MTCTDLVKTKSVVFFTRFYSRHTLNSPFSAYADGKSFPAYINNLRLQDAIHLLQEEPELSIQDIADAAWAHRDDWDIAVCDSLIRTNGGTSGMGQGALSSESVSAAVSDTEQEIW